MRAFIAIELPKDIKAGLSKIQEELKAESLKIEPPSISWVKPQNLHLTLKFLGDIPAEQLKEIKQIISETTKTISGFRLRLEAAGFFPNLQTARIIWVGANQPPPELKQLAQQLEARLVKSGMPQEERDFRPHITIGRIKNRLNSFDLEKILDKLEKNITGSNWEFNCGEITLFESTLGPGGPAYTVLDQCNLKIT